MGILDALKGDKAPETESEVDAETERLLAEIEGQGKARADLEARAKELKVKFQKNISDDKLRERVAKAEAKLTNSDSPNDVDITEDRVLTNVGKNPYGLTPEITIAAGSEHHLTDEDLADDELTARIDRAVEIGALVRGKVNNKQPTEAQKAHGDRRLTNVGRNPHRIGGHTIAPGDDYILTDMNLADELLMGKVNRAVELGILNRGAD